MTIPGTPISVWLQDTYLWLAVVARVGGTVARPGAGGRHSDLSELLSGSRDGRAPTCPCAPCSRAGMRAFLLGKESKK